MSTGKPKMLTGDRAAAGAILPIDQDPGEARRWGGGAIAYRSAVDVVLLTLSKGLSRHQERSPRSSRFQFFSTLGPYRGRAKAVCVRAMLAGSR